MIFEFAVKKLYISATYEKKGGCCPGSYKYKPQEVIASACLRTKNRKINCDRIQEELVQCWLEPLVVHFLSYNTPLAKGLFTDCRICFGTFTLLRKAEWSLFVGPSPSGTFPQHKRVQHTMTCLLYKFRAVRTAKQKACHSLKVTTHRQALYFLVLFGTRRTDYNNK